VASYDVYWIAVQPAFQRHGLGRLLMATTERLIRAADGRRVYIETSLREHYAGTRAFYERCGYELASKLADFYAPGDGKATFCKLI
jgi:ribosomal protein S18 acetylase RimI-like enzyme